jgi:DNA-binding MarR family transcriptional regulator
MTGRRHATPASAPTQTHTELADEVRLVVTRLARRLRQNAESGLSPSLGAALATIDCHGPLTPSQLADRERVQRPTATRIAARLIEDGLVAREDDPADRRSHRIAATPAGRELIRETRQRKTAYLARALEGLDAEDQRTLARAAQILAGVLEDGV